VFFREETQVPTIVERPEASDAAEPAVAVLIDLHVKRESVEAVKKALQTGLPDILGFDGCLDATLHVNQDDDLNLLFVEHWASREHFERYRAWRAERGDHTHLVPMLAAPLAVKFFDVLR